MLIQPIKNAPFGVTIPNVDCASLASANIEPIRLALHKHQLLVFPNQQHLVPRQEVAFYQKINPGNQTIWRDQSNNPWEVYKIAQGNKAGTYQIPAEPGVLVLGKGNIEHHGLNVRLGGERGAYGKEQGSQVLGGGVLQWHIDGAFYQHEPCHYTQMRCIEAPTGVGHWLSYDDGTASQLWCEAGSTAFASGRIGFDLLSSAAQQSSLHRVVHYASRPFQSNFALGNSGNGLRAVDAVAEQRYEEGEDIPVAALNDPLAKIYPLVWTCPVTNRQALMPHPRCLLGLEQKTKSGSQFLGVIASRLQVEALMRPAINPELVYVHAWQPGDLVIWDNRSLWHSATGKLSRDDRRVMHLTAFNGNNPPRCNSQPD